MPRNRLTALCLLPLLTAGVSSAVADDTPEARSLQVELPNQTHNVVKTSWPGIACWFWTDEEFQPEGYKRFIDLHEKHSAAGLLTTHIRHPSELTDPDVFARIKAAAEYARDRGIQLVMDLDIRQARTVFLSRYPDEMQEIVRMREVPLTDSGEVSLRTESLTLGDHYTFRSIPFVPLAGRLLRVYSYVAGPQGVVKGTLADISDRCTAVEDGTQGVDVRIPCRADDRGRTACVMAAFTLFMPSVFAPHLTDYEHELIVQYGKAPLAGACKDEWGFPCRVDPATNDQWFCRNMAEAYAARRPGHDLVRDFLLMWKGEEGLEQERAGAINHCMEMYHLRNAEIENSFYEGVKEVFGPAGVAATHPTWYEYPSINEVFKNGLDWWECRRDLAQTDHFTPYCVRTALAKKWYSPIWVNMYFNPSLAPYDEEIWRHALGGGRINFHPRFPDKWENFTTSLLSGKLYQAEARVRLLNYISSAPVDCPVAVVFGHPAALHWTEPGAGDAGSAITDALWEQGQYADLIPSSEIAAGALRIDEEGFVAYGPQRYTAVVLYHPQYERADVADFFNLAASKSKTRLFRVGDWTADFDGRPFDGRMALPETMTSSDASQCVQDVLAHLRAEGIEAQTPSAMRTSLGMPASMMPEPRGQCRLLDGTLIFASGKDNVMGDPLSKSVRLQGRDITFDAVGVAAVRLDAGGQVAAMACGGLKFFAGPGLSIELDTRADVALWRNAAGDWEGVLQGWVGPIPDALSNITGRWSRLRLPQSME